MKKTLPIIFTVCALSLFAQEYPEVSYSSNYSEHAFYSLTDNATTNIDNNSWEIALSVFGNGIFINETSVVFGDQNILYLAPTDNFDDVINSGDLSGRLLNDEISWDYGAFNSPRDINDANDFGWGIYDPMTGVISGSRVFAIRLKNGNFKKLQIVSLDQGVYTIKYADLDGNNEAVVTVNKADFPGHHFAYLSLMTEQTLDNTPAEWDLLFTRYSTPVDDGAGGYFDLVTSGVLSAPGVEVAEARGVDPETVEYTDFVDSLSTVTDVIGYDWKEFDNVAWTLATDLAYFVKIPTGQVYKIIFFTFGGSSTGDVLFEKTTILANNVEENSVFENFEIYPNPVDENSTAVFSLKQKGEVKIILSDFLGQKIWSGKYNGNNGLNAVQLPGLNIPPGTYVLSLEKKGEVVSRKVYK